MRPPHALLASLLLNATAFAQVSSTADEWAERFAPEAGPAPALPAYADAYDRAAADVAAGRYRSAINVTAAVTPPDATRVGLVRARALVGLGDVDEALGLLSRPPLADDFDAIVYQAEVLLGYGETGDARELIDRAVDTAPTNAHARLLRGRLYEQLGDFPTAVASYQWFIDPPQDGLQKFVSDPDAFEDASYLTDLATAVHRWATLKRAYKDTQSLNDTVLGMYTRAFDVVDRGYTPARLAAAEFCLSRGDAGKASALLKPLEKSMPRSNDLLNVLAHAAIDNGNDNAMRGIADRLFDNDPESPAAEVLQLHARARSRSPALLAKALKLHQRWDQRLDISGVSAALAYLAGDENKFAELIAQADAASPNRSDAHVAAAGLLDAAFQRDAAAALLRTAIARTPWETRPRHLLGDLLLNDGHDDQAREVLQAARDLDPYNVKTLNYLNLLDELAKYDKRVTPHLVLYADKDADPISAQQIGDYLESVYDDVCGVFDFRPKDKIVVQIYPNDDEFSVRIAGVPGVENYGVSFGRVLAAVAPRKGTKQGNFNWARVLRHEFVHTINLMATNNRCPRWLTEGLAVWQEKVPFRFADVPAELYARTMAGELFTVRGFPLAYVRPKKRTDGEQAYTQGAYLATYLAETYGPASIVKLLDAYGKSMTDDQAFEHATGRPLPEVEAGWHAWMKTKLRPWGYDAETAAKYKALVAEGDAFIKARKFAEAVKVYEQACAAQPMEVKPHQRLAGLYLQKDVAEPVKAIEHLEFLHPLELQDNRFAKQVARLYDRNGDVMNAAKWAREATYVDLYDPAAHDLLAAALDKLGDPSAATTAREAAAQVRVWQAKRGSEAGR